MNKWFFFSRGERIGVISLLTLLAILITVYFSLPYLFPSLKRTLQEKSSANLPIEIKRNKFNPNTLDSAGFIMLGLTPSLTKRIINYRKAGGKFKAPDDFSKIYGLKDSVFFLLRPYIDIPSSQRVEKLESIDSKYAKKRSVGNKPKARFDFDPNTIDSLSMINLGLPHWMARNVIKYRLFGGKFKSSSDFRKIYGLTDSLFSLLEPHIKIEQFQDSLLVIEVNDSIKMLVVEMNKADSSELTNVRGIGPSFASRIISYRNKLGGFYKPEQLAEVYGMQEFTLDSALLTQLFIDSLLIRKIHVNYSPFSELRLHPYLSYKQAELIVRARSKKTIDSWEELISLQIVIKRDERLIPYLDFDVLMEE